MKNILLILVLGLFTIISCGDSCDCSESWDATITYVDGDSVMHDGECWIAVNQGRGIIPGPWLENGNDIWEKCS